MCQQWKKTGQSFFFLTTCLQLAYSNNENFLKIIFSCENYRICILTSKMVISSGYKSSIQAILENTGKCIKVREKNAYNFIIHLTSGNILVYFCPFSSSFLLPLSLPPTSPSSLLFYIYPPTLWDYTLSIVLSPAFFFNIM